MRDSNEEAKVQHFFFADAHTKMMVAKTASLQWAYSLLKCWDAVFGKIKANTSFETYTELCNAPLSSSTKLFPF